MMKKVTASIFAVCLLLLSACTANQPPEQTQSIPDTPTPAETDTPITYTEYTIKFDKNTTPDDVADDEIFEYEVSGFDENWQPVTTVEKSVLTIPYSENAYIEAAVPAPTREGYAFAGWQTRPNVTEADLVNGVSPYLWMFGTQSNSYGTSSAVMKIQDMESLDENGTATLYARWVETKDIATEKELQEISKDLYGSYRLTADITLTEPWTPVGIYFSNYEFFAPEWWTYAFRGSFDGNGHTISGLQIRSSNANVSGYADQAAVWHDDGNRADGCAAMFGAITSADIRNVILQAPVIELIGENAVRGDYIYASAVAAFDMQSTLTNVTVNDPVINVEIKGGSTMVTVHQVGQSIAGALERTQGGKCWPIGWYNLTWKEMLLIMHKHLGRPKQKVITIPDWMFTMGCKAMKKQQEKNNIDGGLYMPKLAKIQCNELFIDKSLGCVPLGVEEDDIDAAIGDSVRLCADIIQGKAKTIGMKGE